MNHGRFPVQSMIALRINIPSKGTPQHVGKGVSKQNQVQPILIREGVMADRAASYAKENADSIAQGKGPLGFNLKPEDYNQLTKYY